MPVLLADPLGNRSIYGVPENDFSVMPGDVVIILGMDQSQPILLPISFVHPYIFGDTVLAQPFVLYESAKVLE